MRNYFITLEGIEGAGKSTALKFLSDFLLDNQVDFIVTREPGGTQIAEKIREVLLNHYQEQMHPDAELLLYFASRAQHLNQVIIPALQLGKWVICDRFTDTTYAYQGGGRGLSCDKIRILENLVQGDLRPDYTLLFDADPKECFARMSRKNKELDRLEVENQDFFDKVRKSYLDMAHADMKRFYIVDAGKSPEEVLVEIKQFLARLIGK